MLPTVESLWWTVSVIEMRHSRHVKKMCARGQLAPVAFVTVQALLCSNVTSRATPTLIEAYCKPASLHLGGLSHITLCLCRIMHFRQISKAAAQLIML